MDQQEDMLSGMENSNVSENDIPVCSTGQTSKSCYSTGCKPPTKCCSVFWPLRISSINTANQVPVLQQNTSVLNIELHVVNQHEYHNRDLYMMKWNWMHWLKLSENERESAIERDVFLKRVQDKGKIISLLTSYPW